MKKSFVFSILLLFISSLSWCQSIGIGTTSPDASAQVDISSKSKGLLIPRMTLAERNNIINPAIGLMIYNTDDSSFYIHHTTWHKLALADKVWSVNGNGVIDADHFIGTTNDQPIKLKVNSILRMQLDDLGRLQLYNPNNNLFIGHEAGSALPGGTENFIIGHRAGYSNIAGSQNQFTGYQAGYNNTSGSYNHFTGYEAGYYNTTGSYNHFTGYRAGFSNVTGTENFFSGYQAGANNLTGSHNHFTGFLAGHGNTTGSSNYFSGLRAGRNNISGDNNLFIGLFAGYSNTIGLSNFFIGNSAGYSNTEGFVNQFVGLTAGFKNTTGFNNYFSGFRAGRDNETGDENFFVGNNAGMKSTADRNHFAGFAAGHNTTTGSENHCAGYKAGFINTTGSHNTIIGYEADVTTDNLNNAAAIGYKAKVSQNNSFVIGGTGTDAVNVGIGTTAPQLRLDVNSITSNDVAIFRSTGGWGQILVTQGTVTAHLGSDQWGGYSGTSISGDFRIRLGDFDRMFFQHSTGNVGVGTNSPSSRLHVNGTITATAPLNVVSDAKYKTNISPLTNALNTVQQLQGVSYDLKRDEFPAMNFPSSTQIGFIAQQVEEILPAIVKTDAQGNKSISYTSVIPLLVEAIKELRKEVDELKRTCEKPKSN